MNNKNSTIATEEQRIKLLSIEIKELEKEIEKLEKNHTSFCQKKDSREKSSIDFSPLYSKIKSLVAWIKNNPEKSLKLTFLIIFFIVLLKLGAIKIISDLIKQIMKFSF